MAYKQGENKQGEKSIAKALPASSILLVRDEPAGLEVLMIERAKTMKFAPGAFVFPGGKVDREDNDQNLWGPLTNSGAHCSDLPSRIAVLRELYEEASVLLTVRQPPAANVTHELSGYLQRSNSILDTEGLVPFAHWVTPETMPRRFNTYFYLAKHNGQDAVHDGDEAISMRWVRPKDLLHDWGADKVPLMFPTRLNLIKLARAETVEDALNLARSDDIACTLPMVSRDENGVTVTINDTAGYGVTQATEKELRVERPK